jgi:hypothetical protein
MSRPETEWALPKTGVCPLLSIVPFGRSPSECEHWFTFGIRSASEVSENEWKRGQRLDRALSPSARRAANGNGTGDRNSKSSVVISSGRVERDQAMERDQRPLFRGPSRFGKDEY